MRGLSTDLYGGTAGPWTVADVEEALTELGATYRATRAAVCYRPGCTRPGCLPAAAAYRHRGAKPARDRRGGLGT